MLDTRTEILGVANKYLERVRASGSENIMSLCPFHEDNTPSFAMNVLNGVYFCHSCHAKGNLFTFLRGVGVARSIIDLQYRELLDEARKATPPGPDPMDPGVFSMEPLPEQVLGNFDGYSQTSLLSNGFTEQTLRYFDVGFDRWHDRVTYPIRDLKGHLVAVSGRTIHPGVKPRYKIYNKEYTLWGLPERGTWDRRKVLYNMHNVLPTLYVHKPAHSILVVVEGYKACMWVWQAGIRNVVALMGSYFSWEHRWLIERFSGNVYFFLDNNDAGILGTHDAGLALRNNLSTIRANVIEYPTRLSEDVNAQPDNLTAEEVWEQLFDAVPYNAWLAKQMGPIPSTHAHGQ